MVSPLKSRKRSDRRGDQAIRHRFCRAAPVTGCCARGDFEALRRAGRRGACEARTRFVKAKVAGLYISERHNVMLAIEDPRGGTASGRIGQIMSHFN